MPSTTLHLLPKREYHGKLWHEISDTTYYVPLQVNKETTLDIGDSFQPCNDNITFTYTRADHGRAIFTYEQQGKAVEVYLLHGASHKIE